MSTGSAPRRGLAPQGPSLNIVLEFARAEAAASPHAFRFAAQQYLVRTPGGGIEAAELPWTPALLADLAVLREPAPPAATVHGLGHVLRDFLAGTGWAAHEQAIVAAAQAGAPIRVTIRSAAAELYALPWELLALKSSGQLLGGVPGLVIRYEWPETQSAPDPMPGSSRVGRTLLAWSAAGGAVPAADHVSALSTSFGPLRFDPKRDVLAHTSLAALAAALQRARSEDPAIDVLYLLSHGAAHGANYGMVLDGADALDGPALVDAGRLQQLIAPHAGMLRMVVIAACDGANAGTPGNHLGSVAQMIHRAGIPVVIASRTPLRASAASRMCAALFGSLATQTGLLTAFLAVRDALMHDATALDWANVQLYARAADGEPSLPPGPGERRPAPPRDGPRWPRIRPWTAVGAASTALVLSAWHLAPGGGQTDPQPPTPPATAPGEAPAPGTATSTAPAPAAATARTWRQVAALDRHGDAVTFVGWGPEGRWLVSAARDRVVRVWDLSTLSEKCTSAALAASLEGAAAASDGRWVASATNSGIRVWSVPDCAELDLATSELARREYCQDVAFVPRGLVTLCGWNHIELWRLPGGQALAEARNSADMLALSAARDADVVAARERVGALRIWSMASATPTSTAVLRLAEPGAVLADRGFTVTPDGRHAVAGVGREFMTWDLTSNRSDAPRGPVDGDVLAVTAHAGGEPIAAAGMDGVARVWSMTGVAPLALLRHPAPVRAVAFAPDGRRLATGCDDHVVRIWEPVDD